MFRLTRLFYIYIIFQFFMTKKNVKKNFYQKNSIWKCYLKFIISREKSISCLALFIRNEFSKIGKFVSFENRNFWAISLLFKYAIFRDECLTGINNEAKSRRWVYFFFFMFEWRFITSVYIGRSTRVINESRSWKVCRLFNLSITASILWNFIFSNESFFEHG